MGSSDEGSAKVVEVGERMDWQVVMRFYMKFSKIVHRAGAMMN
jgi:hypothetical protein